MSHRIYGTGRPLQVVSHSLTFLTSQILDFFFTQTPSLSAALKNQCNSCNKQKIEFRVQFSEFSYQMSDVKVQLSDVRFQMSDSLSSDF